MMEPFLKAAL